jgi:hypothetical protein
VAADFFTLTPDAPGPDASRVRKKSSNGKAPFADWFHKLQRFNGVHLEVSAISAQTLERGDEYAHRS